MLVFDSFKSREDAERFAKDVRARFRKRADVHATQDEVEGKGLVDWASNNEHVDGKLHDFFPFDLTPPIVLVERGDAKAEAQIKDLVEEYGGVYAGT